MRLPYRVLLLLVATGCGGNARPSPGAGALDLSSWSVGSGPVLLDGEWRMYWAQVVSDVSGDAPEPDATTSLRIWNDLPLRDGRRVPRVGFATYQLRVHLPSWAADGKARLGIYVPSASTAYRLIVRDRSGQMLGSLENGRFATNANDGLPLQRPETLRFSSAEDLLITFYVSNWEHARGGPWAIPMLGLDRDLDGFVTRERVLDLIVIGILLMVAMQSLAIFVLRRREQGPIWLAALCLLLAVRAVVTRHFPEQIWGESWSWPLGLRLAYLTFSLSVASAALFFGELFRPQMPRSIVRIVVGLSLVESAVVVVTPPLVFTQTLTAFQAFTVAGMIWILGVLVTLCARRDRIAMLVLCGFLSIAFTVLHDIRYTQSVFSGSYASHYGLAGFVVFQALVLAVMNERARRELEARNTEVHELNETLRHSIGERSHQLREALKQLETHERRELQPGQILAERYRIERVLGTGGMGVVYEATRLSDQRRLALKVVRGGFSRDKLARFAQEAELATRISHPNVVSLLDFELTDDGECFFAMELVTGGTLEQQRERFGDVAWALPILRQLAQAMDAVHAASVVHRDLKPGNVLCEGSVVKLADFGIAGLSGAARIPTLAPGARLADTIWAQQGLTGDAVLGSPPYMAPELAAGSEHATSRSDVFSFGVIAFELLGGRRPFERSPILDRAEGRRWTPPHRLVELAPALELGLTVLIDRCLHADPAKRPTVAEIRVGLG